MLPREEKVATPHCLSTCVCVRALVSAWVWVWVWAWVWVCGCVGVCVCVCVAALLEHRVCDAHARVVVVSFTQIVWENKD